MSYRRRLKDALLIYLEDALKLSEDVLQMSYKRSLTDVLPKDVGKMPYRRRLAKS